MARMTRVYPRSGFSKASQVQAMGCIPMRFGMNVKIFSVASCCSEFDFFFGAFACPFR